MAAREVSCIKCDLLEYSSGYQQSNGKMRLEGRSKKNYPDSPMRVEAVQMIVDNCIQAGSGRIKLVRLDANGAEQTMETVPIESLCRKTLNMINEAKSRGQKLAPFEYPMSAAQGHTFVSLRFWKEGDKNKRRVIEMTLSNPDVLRLVEYLRRIDCPIAEKSPSRASSSQGAALSSMVSDHRPLGPVLPYNTDLRVLNTNSGSYDPVRPRNGWQSAPGDVHFSNGRSSALSTTSGPARFKPVSSMSALEHEPFTALGARASSVSSAVHGEHAAVNNQVRASFERPASVSSAIRPNEIEQMFPDRLSSSGRDGSRGAASRDEPPGEDRALNRDSLPTAIPFNRTQQVPTTYMGGDGMSSSTSAYQFDSRAPLQPNSGAANFPPIPSEQHYRPQQGDEIAQLTMPQRAYTSDQISGSLLRSNSISTPNGPHPTTQQIYQHPIQNQSQHLAQNLSQHPTQNQPQQAINPVNSSTYNRPPVEEAVGVKSNQQVSDLKDFFALDPSVRQQVYLACQALHDPDERGRAKATRALALVQLSSPDFLALLEGVHAAFQQSGLGTSNK